MTHKARDWARLQPWFECSDSRFIWSKDANGHIDRWSSVRALRKWDAENYVNY
jgi:hypothetical protein